MILPKKQKLVIIAGPTSIGKTSLAIRIAGRFNGEIISSDSMQVYKFMDIGTAKPTHEEQKAAKHHLIDVVLPDEHFDAALFAERAGKTAEDLEKRCRTPIIAGGTGLYIKALLHGLSDIPLVNENIREKLKKEAAITGSAALHEKLADVDPVSFKTLHPNDTQRIIRALEVFETTGIPISEVSKNHGFADSPYDTLKIGLTVDRKTLYERINLRTDLMMKAGFIDEVKSLLDMGYHRNLKSMQSIGYRHIADYLSGDSDLDISVETLKRDTRRYAKRQYTWFIRDKEMNWFSMDEKGQADKIEQRVKLFLSE